MYIKRVFQLMYIKEFTFKITNRLVFYISQCNDYLFYSCRKTPEAPNIYQADLVKKKLKSD